MYMCTSILHTYLYVYVVTACVYIRTYKYLYTGTCMYAFVCLGYGLVGTLPFFYFCFLKAGVLHTCISMYIPTCIYLRTYHHVGTYMYLPTYLPASSPVFPHNAKSCKHKKNNRLYVLLGEGLGTRLYPSNSLYKTSVALRDLTRFKQ